VAATATGRLVRERTRPYLAYLLRLWQVRDEGQTGWRASVENVHTGERLGFASLTELWAFLEKEIGEAAQSQVVADRGERGGDIHT
jgi:hypothetical protein